MKLSNVASLRLLLAGIFISALGGSLSSLGFSLLAAQTGQSALLAAVLAANLVPTVLLGLIGGHLADRKLAWWWWPASLLCTSLITATMALTLNWTVIIAGCALMSSCTALVGPVAQKLASYYSQDAAETGSTLATVQGLAGLSGVALGGVSFGAGAMRTMLWVDATAMLILAGIGLLVSRTDAISLDTSTEKFRWYEGLTLIARPQVFGLLGSGLIVTTVLSTSLDDVAGVFALIEILGLTPAQYGVTSAAWMLGIMAGSWLSQYLGGNLLTKHPLTALPIGLSIGLVGLCAPSFLIILLLFFLGGAGNGAFNAVTNRIIISSVPQTAQGRAWAGFRWIVYVCLLLGYLLGAVFAMTYPTQLMAIGGCLLVVCALSNLAVRVLIRPGSH